MSQCRRRAVNAGLWPRILWKTAGGVLVMGKGEEGRIEERERRNVPGRE